MKNTVLLLTLILCGCAITSFDGSIIPATSTVLKEKFTQGQYTASNDVNMMFRVYYPDLVTPRTFPIIVYLHGAGQNGVDNEKQLDGCVGALYSFTYDREDYKSVILAPQCPDGVYWRDEDMLEALKELIEKFKDNQLIDEDRVYVTGFSMGGDASWKLALNYPELMTTVMPVCGGPLESMEPDIPDVPVEMSNLNIWAFNNFDDGTVRPSYSKRIFGELWTISDGEHLNFTEYVSGGHNPKQVYTNRDILIWMLSTRKK